MVSFIKSLLTVIFLITVLASCEKTETPYPIPERPNVSDSMIEDQLFYGDDYNNQIFYSFKSGVVATNHVSAWDLYFTTRADSNEVRMNGALGHLLYLTEATNMSAINSTYAFDYRLWRYDHPNGLMGTSGAGILNNSEAIGKIWVLKANNETYKIKFISIDAQKYELEVAKGINSTQTQQFTIEKDTNVTHQYFSLEEGVVAIEPPKTLWDLEFVTFRHIYEGYNQDGTDFLYPVAGVLLNPYNTKGARDTTISFDYFQFTKDAFERNLRLVPNRDVIGWNWKEVDINTVKYTVRPRIVYVVRDMEGVLWKLHFFGFHNDLGQNGYPQFRFEPLR